MITPPLVLFLAGSPGPLELLVIFAVVLILFGPRKLPGVARSVGRMLSELRKASEDFRSQVMSIDEGGKNSPPQYSEALLHENEQAAASDAEPAETTVLDFPAIHVDPAAFIETKNSEASTQGRSVQHDDGG